MNIMQTDVFDAFGRRWALLSAGTLQDYNTMTISWGGLGVLWSKKVATVYVRPSRHTYGYMEKNDYFTVSFYPEECKKDLSTLGTLSGRDGDKVAKTALTACTAGQSVSFAQAELTLVCRKLYAQDIDKTAMPPELSEKAYGDEAPHRMYIGEVVQIISK